MEPRPDEVRFNVSVVMDIEELRKRLSSAQTTALLNGIAEVLNAGKPLPAPPVVA